MKNSLLLQIILSLPLMCFVSTASLAALPSNIETEKILRKQLIESGQAVGVAVALVDISGIRLVSVGNASKNIPLSEENLFEIASLTKTFTGILLALAQEKGEIKLEEPVEKFLPNGLTLRDKNNEAIRLVDLATHRSGLPRLASNLQPLDVKNPYADFTEQDLLDFVKNFKATRVRNSQYEYSNIGFGILGYILTHVAKASSYAELVQERILKPLQMESTTADPQRFLNRIAKPHDSSGKPTPLWDMPQAHAGAGALRATPGDMGRYIQAIAGITQTPLSNAILQATLPREQGPNPINPIGLAFIQVPFHERKFIYHEGSTMGTSSSMLIDSSTKEGIFIVANTSTRLFEVALELMDQRFKMISKKFPEITKLTSETLARYVGTYKLTEEMSIVIRMGTEGNLIAKATGQSEFELFPESEIRFFAKVVPLVITFGDIAEGKANSFLLEQGGVKHVVKRSF